jgi:hypothetical protein
MYLLIAVGATGTRVAQTTTPRVPEGFVGPGEVAFVVEALDCSIMHTHQTGVIPISER